VRFVQVFHGYNGGAGLWDAHANLQAGHSKLAKEIDQPIGALLSDLKQRGLLDETIVVIATEFGRTPGAERSNGRDHHPYGFSIALAGGGIQGGIVHGATDELGFHAAENRHYVTDLHATVLHQLGLGPVFRSLSQRQYENDEQIDNALRSVLFQIPKPGIADPSVCGVPVVNPDCFSGVSDLGAIDVARGRDHGMPTYNDLRRAYGLAPKTSFVDVTGESTQRFPVDPLINALDPINDPNILDFIELRDADADADR